jgi:hypothetical protein
MMFFVSHSLLQSANYSVQKSSGVLLLVGGLLGCLILTVPLESLVRLASHADVKQESVRCTWGIFAQYGPEPSHHTYLASVQ